MPSGGQNRFPQQVVDQIRHMIEVDKVQQRKVADQLKISVSAVERICKRNGIKTQRTGPRSGSGHTNWKGGKKLVGKYYYIYSPTHPNATKGHYVAEHRLVMEQKLGRYLLPSEVVHHIDGDPTNNNPDNLIAFPTNKQHLKEELKGKIPNWTDDGLEKIRKGVERAANLKRLKRGDNQPPQPIDRQTSQS